MSLRFATLPAALVLLSLSACTGSGGGSTEPPAAQDANSGELATACVSGIWNLDTTAAANLMLQYLIAKGAPVTAARGDGPVELHLFSDGTATYRSGVTYDFSAVTDGVNIQIMQSQTGGAQGEWGWTNAANTTIGFTGWSNNIQITSTAEVGGQAANIPIQLPDMGPGSVPLTVTCTSDLLTTKADQSPFTLDWRRG